MACTDYGVHYIIIDVLQPLLWQGKKAYEYMGCSQVLQRYTTPCRLLSSVKLASSCSSSC
jgi:hypothetical protein